MYINQLGESFTDVSKGIAAILKEAGRTGVDVYRTSEGLPISEEEPPPGSDEAEDAAEGKTNTAMIAIVIGILAIGAVFLFSKKKEE